MKSSAKAILGVFLYSPFLSLFMFNKVSVRHFSNILWAFVVFYGMTFTIASDDVDSSTYHKKLVMLHKKQNISYIQFSKGFYSDKSTDFDILEPSIRFFVSRFSDSGKILFTFYALFYGFFYSRNVSNILVLFKKKWQTPKLLTSLILLSCFFIIPIWQINGFRFWTAAHIFLYGCFIQFKKRENSLKAILVVVSSVFVHLTFIPAVLVFLLSRVLKMNYRFFFITYIASFFVSSLNTIDLINIMDYLPGNMVSRYSSYMNPDVLEASSKAIDNRNWYIRYNGVLFLYFCQLVLLLSYFVFSKIQEKSYNLKHIVSFSLLFYSFANFATLLPSGFRFLSVANFLAIFTFINLYLTNKNIIFKNIIFRSFSFVVLSLFFVVSIRYWTDSATIYTIFGNPIIGLFSPFDVSPLIDYIKI